MKKALVVYHGPTCLDGMAAAWCMWQYLKDDAEYIVGRYQSVEDIDFAERVVYLVDFSYKRDFMEKHILPVAKMVYLIDHHESALNELEGIEKEWPNIDTTYSSLLKSGAMLAKLFVSKFGPELDAPLIDIIQDRDLWNFNIASTKAVTAALYALALDYKSIDKYMEMQEPFATELLTMGQALLTKQASDVAGIIAMGLRMVPAHVFAVDEPGLLIPVCNAPPMLSSDVGNALAKEYPFAVTYHDMRTTRDYSLRSEKSNPNAMNVANIALKFGGGGHKHAAGFKLKMEETWPHPVAWPL